MAGGARNQTERAIGSVVQGHQRSEDKLEQLIKLYLNLGQRPQNAASNVPLSSDIEISTHWQNDGQPGTCGTKG
jgi:hypothetical protein